MPFPILQPLGLFFFVCATCQIPINCLKGKVTPPAQNMNYGPLGFPTSPLSLDRETPAFPGNFSMKHQRVGSENCIEEKKNSAATRGHKTKIFQLRKVPFSPCCTPRAFLPLSLQDASKPLFTPAGSTQLSCSASFPEQPSTSNSFKCGIVFSKRPTPAREISCGSAQLCGTRDTQREGFTQDTNGARIMSGEGRKRQNF